MSTGTFGLKAVHYHYRDPGTQWRKDPHITIDLDRPLDSQRILTPNVIRLPAGNYRMYYTGVGPGRKKAETMGYILSAISADGDRWEKESGIRIDVHRPHATHRTLCPDVIPLQGGGFRMYYEARTIGCPTVVLSAKSTDGLAWELEPGIRYSNSEWSYGSPRCLYIHDAALGMEWRYRLYFHRFSVASQSPVSRNNVIISAVSKDGLLFEEEEGIRIAQETPRETTAVYAPEVIRLGDGSYRMYYPPWCPAFSGGVFTATSTDGLFWFKEPNPCLDLGDRWDSHMISEPCVIELPDGRSRMFYEAKDACSKCRILSATTV